MEIECGSVSWVEALAFDDERDSALIAGVGKIRNCTMWRDGDRYTVFDFFGRKKGWVRYDVESDKKGRREQCVVIGRTEGSVDKEHYYILVVVPTRIDGEYRRVGVGMVRSSCVVSLRADVRIV
jgi:hypothetical protein